MNITHVKDRTKQKLTDNTSSDKIELTGLWNDNGFFKSNSSTSDCNCIVANMQ